MRRNFATVTRHIMANGKTGRILADSLDEAAGRVLVFDTDPGRYKAISESLRVLNYKAVSAFEDSDPEDFGGNADIAIMVGDLSEKESVSRRLLDCSEQYRRLPVLRLSGSTSSPAVNECLDKHFSWEFDPSLKTSQLRFLLKRAEHYRGRDRDSRLIGDSRAMRRVRRLIEHVADFDTTVLITGESGTGKELAAQTAHELSTRGDQPFVPLNCGAIPAELLESELFGHEKGAFTGAINARKGRFELAEGGTLFLDEIGDMSLEMQAKLLRVLQERCYERVGGTTTLHCNVRVIAATHRDLKERVSTGEFRADLYYRVNVFPIEMPPLRARISDLPTLLEVLSARHQPDGSGVLRWTRDAVRALSAYSWPGNVRELSNLVERLSILHPDGIVDRVDLPARYSQSSVAPIESPLDTHRLDDSANLKQRMERIEKRLIESALAETGYVVADAARRLNLRRTTLVEKINKYDLRPDR